MGGTAVLYLGTSGNLYIVLDLIRVVGMEYMQPGRTHEPEFPVGLNSGSSSASRTSNILAMR